MAWLEGWVYRMEFYIDQAKVPYSLSDFPVPFVLGAGVGVGEGGDSSAVFDDIEDADRKKIAITTDDGETQCYVEIEKWDSANRKAWLHVKLPSISPALYTRFYLYYDPSQPENTSYVGDPGDAAAQNVWDADFAGVYHLSQDPAGDVVDAIKDSTSNGCHMTPRKTSGDMVSEDLVAGKFGGAIELDGSDEYLRNDNTLLGTVLNNCLPMTTEILFKPDSTGFGWEKGIVSVAAYEPNWAGDYNGHVMSVQNVSGGSAKLGSWVGNGGDGPSNRSIATTDNYCIVGDEWNYLVGVISSGSTHVDHAIYVNTIPQALTCDDGTNTTNRTTYNYTSVGAFYGWRRYNPLKGQYCEFRVSKVARSEGWLKTTYYGLHDNLVIHPGADVIQIERDRCIWNDFDKGGNIELSTDRLTALHH